MRSYKNEPQGDLSLAAQAAPLVAAQGSSTGAAPIAVPITVPVTIPVAVHVSALPVTLSVTTAIATHADFFGREQHRAEFGRTAQFILIARQRIQREIVLIQMVLQIKNAGKAGAGEFRLFPSSLAGLLFGEIADAALNHPFRGQFVLLARGQQADQSPRGLRRGADSLALQCRIVVRGNGFAVAAIRILHGPQPVHPASRPIARLEAQRFQRANYSPGSIHVVHAPASIPGAVRALVTLQKS